MSDIAAISDQNREKERAVRLLLGAVRTLSPQDQDVVLALLLQGLTSDQEWQAEVLRGDERRRLATGFLGLTELQPGRQIKFPGGSNHSVAPRSEAKVLPVRLPAQTHEQLKSWCYEHDFTMAAVVRGLVERFLRSERVPDAS